MDKNFDETALRIRKAMMLDSAAPRKAPDAEWSNEFARRLRSEWESSLTGWDYVDKASKQRILDQEAEIKRLRAKPASERPVGWLMMDEDEHQYIVFVDPQDTDAEPVYLHPIAKPAAQEPCLTQHAGWLELDGVGAWPAAQDCVVVPRAVFKEIMDDCPAGSRPWCRCNDYLSAPTPNAAAQEIQANAPSLQFDCPASAAPDATPETDVLFARHCSEAKASKVNDLFTLQAKLAGMEKDARLRYLYKGQMSQLVRPCLAYEEWLAAIDAAIAQEEGR